MLDIQLKNIRISIDQVDGRPAIVLDDVHNSKFFDIETQSVSQTDLFSVRPNCKEIDLGEEIK